ncbi:exported hypothetical protein [uncultured Mycobacterium sp.]|uniref:O-acyltransferase WSD1 C-terminal domain-containing protein n=1 Tax=uncultured Mycobacterium sp. TaxID=171292 RepID=A0A1Y5PKM2_9MYCO|nr:exported hypothetical protein [uncultured Mycobacterium sp.]
MTLEQAAPAGTSIAALPFSAPAIATTTVSNAPGPTEPIYFADARRHLDRRDR